jgi:hypothetical protein
LIGVFLVTGLVSLVRGLLVLRFAPALAAYELSLPPTLSVGFYWVWAVLLFGEMAVCFLRIECHARLVAVIYQVTLWTIRLVGDRVTPIRRLWPRDLILSLLFVVSIWFLSSRRTER